MQSSLIAGERVPGGEETSRGATSRGRGDFPGREFPGFFFFLQEVNTQFQISGQRAGKLVLARQTQASAKIGQLGAAPGGAGPARGRTKVEAGPGRRNGGSGGGRTLTAGNGGGLETNEKHKNISIPSKNGRGARERSSSGRNSRRRRRGSRHGVAACGS